AVELVCAGEDVLLTQRRRVGHDGLHARLARHARLVVLLTSRFEGHGGRVLALVRAGDGALERGFLRDHVAQLEAGHDEVVVGLGDARGVAFGAGLDGADDSGGAEDLRVEGALGGLGDGGGLGLLVGGMWVGMQAVEATEDGGELADVLFVHLDVGVVVGFIGVE
ncbi:MAG: hypothetical protein Q9207_006491, partial [Kuettlingeria erythrocarpa]